MCPHCGRRFNPKVADRHIEACANMKHKPKPPPTREDIDEQQQQRLAQRSPFKSQRYTISEASATTDALRSAAKVAEGYNPRFEMLQSQFIR